MSKFVTKIIHSRLVKVCKAFIFFFTTHTNTYFHKLSLSLAESWVGDSASNKDNLWKYA